MKAGYILTTAAALAMVAGGALAQGGAPRSPGDGPQGGVTCPSGQRAPNGGCTSGTPGNGANRPTDNRPEQARPAPDRPRVEAAAPKPGFNPGDAVAADMRKVPDPRRFGLDPNKHYVRHGDTFYQVDAQSREILAFVGALADLMN